MIGDRDDFRVVQQAIRGRRGRVDAESRLGFIELERRTGVLRQSLMKFARGEQSLRLDKAEKLFDCLALELVKRKAK